MIKDSVDLWPPLSTVHNRLEETPRQETQWPGGVQGE